MTGLRERKKADTRRALSDAALELTFERGIDGVTRDDIARLAGVSLRTFNNYFAGKYEALAYSQVERIRHSIAEFQLRPTDEPLWTSISEAVAGSLEADFGDVASAENTVPDRRELAEIPKLLMTTKIRNAVSSDLFDDWAAAIAERTGTDPDRDLYPRLVVAVAHAVVDTAMEAYATAEPPVAITALMRRGFNTVAAGLPEPKKGQEKP
jgi:AcrR family transcriptional regulator